MTLFPRLPAVGLITLASAAILNGAEGQSSDPQVVASIDGTVIDASGKPVKVARVMQFNSRGSTFHGGRSDDQGRFTLRARSHDATSKYSVMLPDGILLEATPQTLRPLVLCIAVDTVRIQGIWQATALEDSGTRASPESTRDFKVAITDNAVLMHFGGESCEEHRYVIDPAKKPPTIDLTRADKTIRGIYELNGDELTICLSETRQRATAFVSKPESENDMLMQLRRDNPTDAIEQLKSIQLPENDQVRSGLLTGTNVDFLDLPLPNAMDYLSRLHGVGIHVDQRVLKKSDRDLLISLKTRGVPLHTALVMMLTPLGLEYDVNEGDVLVKPLRRN